MVLSAGLIHFRPGLLDDLRPLHALVFQKRRELFGTVRDDVRAFRLEALHDVRQLECARDLGNTRDCFVTLFLAMTSSEVP